MGIATTSGSRQIAARTTAQDDEIELLGRRTHPSDRWDIGVDRAVGILRGVGAVAAVVRLRPRYPDQVASNTWTANAARIASPVTAERTRSMRVLTPPSSRTRRRPRERPPPGADTSFWRQKHPAQGGF